MRWWNHQKKRKSREKNAEIDFPGLRDLKIEDLR
jgi:hypothetical protein